MLRVMSESELGEAVGGNYPELRYPCPNCGSRDNLAVNMDRKCGRCFSCDLTVKIKEIEEFKRRDLIDVAMLFTDKLEYEQRTIIANMIWRSITQPLTMPAYKYLLSRGLTDDIIRHYGICEGKSRYSNRIIVPTWNIEGQATFFVARDYTGQAQMKYLNPPKDMCQASMNIWNYQNITGPIVVICEGVFTAIRANQYLGGDKAVAVFGKVVKEYQVKKLLELPVSTYIVCLDADANDVAYDWGKELNRTGRKVYIATTPSMYGEHADITDMTESQFKENLSRAIVYDPEEWAIRRLIECR